MTKKGFTLVELLAVIAILAILVIVAMPNVLGMFNQAKKSSFVTEVQEYMKVAKTTFMTEALKPGNQGQELFFSSTYDDLDMSGAEKSYNIGLDRNGNFIKVILFDDNFCYEASISEGDLDFDVDDVKEEDVLESSDNDTIFCGCNEACPL